MSTLDPQPHLTRADVLTAGERAALLQMLASTAYYLAAGAICRHAVSDAPAFFRPSLEELLRAESPR